MENQNKEEFINFWDERISDLMFLTENLTDCKDRDIVYKIQDQLHNLVIKAGEELED